MHCLAGLDTLTSGAGVARRHRARLARRPRAHGAAPGAGRVRVPVVQPDADAHGARRTSRCRSRSPAASPTRELARRRHRRRRARRPAAAPPVGAVGRPAAARRRSRARWRPGPSSCSPTSRPATSTRRPAPRCSSSSAPRCATWARPSSWSPTTRSAAGYADCGRVPRRRARRRLDGRTHPRAGPRRAEDDRSLTMLRLVISSLRAHVRRVCISTSLAVCLGVALLAGTMVLGDTLAGQLRLAVPVVARHVRRRRAQRQHARRPTASSPRTSSTVRWPTSSPRSTASPPSRRRSRASVSSPAPTARSSAANGPPTFAGNWIEDPDLNPYELVEGRAPATHRRGRHQPRRGQGRRPGGRRSPRSSPRRSRSRSTIVGIATFGGEDGLGPTTFTAFTLAGAEEHVTGQPGEVTALLVQADDGTSRGRARRPHRRVGARRRRGDQRRRARRRGERRDRRRLPRLPAHLPARVRRRRAARRDVQHQQHVLDHRRPASALVGAAAGDRRRPSPGALVARRRVAGRRRRRLVGRVGPSGSAWPRA